MKKENKILLASGLTVFTAFITLLCIFSVDGFSLQTLIAIAAAAFFAHITSCFFKIEQILRRQHAIAKRKQKMAQANLTVVHGVKTQVA